MYDNQSNERAGLGITSRESGQIDVVDLLNKARASDRAWITANLRNPESLFYSPDVCIEFIGGGDF